MIDPAFPRAALEARRLDAHHSHQKKEVRCLPGAHLPSSPKTPPDLSSQTSQRMCWRREKLLWWRVLCSGSLPPHMLTPHFPDTANPAGQSGMKDMVPDSGSSQTPWKEEPRTYLRKCMVTCHTGGRGNQCSKLESRIRTGPFRRS